MVHTQFNMRLLSLLFYPHKIENKKIASSCFLHEPQLCFFFFFFQKEPLTFGVKRGAVGCRVSRGECEQLRGVISQAPIHPPKPTPHPSTLH